MSLAEHRVQSPMWRKIAALTTLFALIPAGGIGLRLLTTNQQALKAVSREVRLTATESAAASVDQIVGGAREDLRGVAQSLGDPTIEASSRIGLARTFVSSSEQLDHAVIFDKKGVYIDAILAGELDYEPRRAELAPGVLDRARDGAMAIGSPARDRIQLVLPLRAAKTQEVTGYVASDVSLEPVRKQLEMLVTEKFDVDRDALVVVNAKGEAVVHAEPTKLGEVVGDGELVARVAEISRIGGVALSQDHGEDLITLKPLEVGDWVVLARVPQTKAYAAIDEMKLMVLAALLVAGLLSVILAIVVSRQLTRPIRDLVKLCRAIASRDFDQRAQIETRDEMAMLGRTLNDAAGQLRDSEEELRRQQAIRADLGRYLPTEVVERIAEDGDLSELDGRREQVSILFADVVGFTQLCEQNEPDVVVAVLNELFTIITEIIFRHQGVVDKFIGDCVMAFWGAPDADPEHAFHAVSAAEDIISWLEIGNAGWREKYGVEIQLAVGVHSGDVIVGNVGSNNRVAYTVVGEAVNLAARLESIARPNQILTSRQTAELVADDFDIVHVGGRRMPGSDDEVELYEVRV